MSLVKSNKNKKKIDRGPSIEPSKKFTMDQLPKTNEEHKEVPFPIVSYEPKPATLKIDTKLRDQINALSLIGYGDTQKEAVELLINNVIDSMTTDEKRKFDYQYQVLEDKTIKTIARKK